MKTVIFKLERNDVSIPNPLETNTKEIVKSIDPIQLKGSSESIDKIDKNLLNKVYLSLCMLNIHSIRELSKKKDTPKSMLIKNFSNNYLFPITDINQDFITRLKNYYPLIEALEFPINSLFDSSICQLITQTYSTIISWVLMSFWRFKEKAEWENISYLLNKNENVSLEIVGFVFLERKDERLILIFSERNDGILSRLKEIYLDNENIQTYFSTNENSPFDLRKHDFKALTTYLENLLKIRDKKLEDYCCFFWTKEPFEKENTEIDFKKESNPDNPMLNFIGNLLNDDWTKYKNVKINEIDQIILELDIDFDIFAKKRNKEKFLILELKQSHDIQKVTGIKELIAFCGRILYINDILEEKLGKTIEIIAFFVTTIKLDSKNFNLKKNIELKIINESNLEDLFLLKKL
ncbi:MAG: hypothetical protein BAJALOKI1v1_440021 [Promethearchaeota archaeon]|nr:MAG: hypothetical protein BAJALOKI1v1_440021 [Candidatus Lokiarchaeota archaeon]